MYSKEDFMFNANSPAETYSVPKKKVGLAKYYFLGHKQAYCAFHKFLAH